MSDNNNRPESAHEADESQSADARLLFARILERLDRLEKKLDSALSGNRSRPSWGGGGENRRPGGFSRPFQSNGGFGGRRSGGPGGPGGRFDGPRSHRPHQGHGRSFSQGNRPQTPR